MADEQPPERDIIVQSSVNVGTATDQTTVSGAKVSVGSAREVHVHGDTTPPPSFRSVLLVGVLAFLGAVLINIATSQLPQGLQPYLWLAWPLAVLVTGASIWVAYRQSRNTSSSVTVGTLDERNRARMLDKVENFWIKGVLNQSLYQIARLELGLEQAPDKIDHPWQTVLQQATTKRAVPAGTPIIKLFDDLDGKLLILGAPGAGKTTLLLELARDLIARARSDAEHPIPLVFNLSTWASKRQPLKEWLADELNQRYDVPEKLAQQWVEANAILPLLDGLDEVAAGQRDACVEAINIYREEYRMMSLAVCSRKEEYERLTGKLKLRSAVAIQPLTQQTVDAYLRQVGRPLSAVRAALKDDPTLWELVESPLLLSIIALAYKDKPVAKLRASGTLEERRRQVFNDYIAAMFGRRGAATRYTSLQMTRQLSWLAKQMVSHSQTVFYIERMQPSLLPSPAAQRWYNIWDRGSGAILSGLLVGLGCIPLFRLFVEQVNIATFEENGPEQLWILFGILGCLAVSLFGGTLNRATRQRRLNRQLIGDTLGGYVIGGLFFGLLFGLQSDLIAGTIGGTSGVFGRLVIGFDLGLYAAFLFGLQGLLNGTISLRPRQILLSERLQWSWRKSIISALSGVGFGVFGGLLFGPFFGPFYGLFYKLGGNLDSELLGIGSGLLDALQLGLDFGLPTEVLDLARTCLQAGLLFGLLFGLLGGLYSDVITTTSYPNQGIRRSAHNSLIGGLAVASCNTLAFGAGLGLQWAGDGISLGGIRIGLGFGLLGGLLGLLAFGGYACFSHLTLRLLLARNGSLPLRLIPFLDYCAERIFLRKVGGGYIFVHRLLMEHFASLYNQQPRAEEARQPTS